MELLMHANRRGDHFLDSFRKGLPSTSIAIQV